jgi:uncharacterized protein (UPF0264 family)
MSVMPALLVSVRSAAEAEAALEGGAALIDVKEPARGSLGRAPAETVAAVVRLVAGRRPVSAALGEWLESPTLPEIPGLAFVKWGLAGCGREPAWRHCLANTSLGRRLVAVAYADWRRAAAPEPEAVCDFACEHGVGAFLLDTWAKDGTTLLDWLSPAAIHSLCGRCRASGVRVALAGSLGSVQITELSPVQPDWFAVRGAVCRGGQRADAVDTEAVRHLAEQVRAVCNDMVYLPQRPEGH